MKRPMYHSLEINKANEELAAENLRLTAERDLLAEAIARAAEKVGIILRNY